MREVARSVVVLCVMFTVARPLEAQSERPIPYPIVAPRAFQAAIEEGTRTKAGVPGPNYWQPWTDYTITARLLTDEKRLEGQATILYHNRSPRPLPALVLHLFQNLHAEGASRNRPSEVTGGVEVHRVTAAAEELGLLRRGQRGGGYAAQGTVLIVRLAEALAAGDSIRLEIDWSFQVPQRGAGGRMGWSRDNLFHIAYWYPQMAVFDDVVGWQADQFLGQAEFYTGFGSYDLTVEAPEGWVVMATGELLNPGEVLSATLLERYQQAHQSDDVVHVLTETDFASGSATAQSQDGLLRWHFRSDTVRDVAFSAMRESLWNAARTPIGDRDGDGEVDYTLVNSFFRSDAPLWGEQWRYAQHSIDFLSRWMDYPYPWPHMTSVEGGGIIGGGMEYPMMTLIGSYRSPQATDTSLYGVTAHELAHMWFPMIVGTDERRYAWMDEGTTSFNGDLASREFYPGNDPLRGSQEEYLFIARQGGEGEMMRLSDYQYPGPAYGTASYSKPATLLNTLRALLGPDRFDEAFREFVAAWAYKHPKPWDFFNFFENAAGSDLDWFWRAWYYETWTLDHAVAGVTDGDGWVTVVIEDRGWVPMPARVRITREGGESLEREVPVQVWLNGATSAEITIPGGAPVVKVEIDPEHTFPDIDRRNNVWERSDGP